MVELRRSTRVASIKKVSYDEDDAETKQPIKKRVKKTVRVHKKESEVEEELKEEDDRKVSELKIGDNMPDLTLENQDGKEISLSQVAKDNKILVIFAYPKASTPGCTRQACGFRDNYEDLKKDSAVYGISADSVASQKKFQTKQHLPYDLLSDPKRTLIGMLGAKKTPHSGIIRSHFIFVDGKLKFKRVKISPEVSVADSKKEVLELVEEFKKK